MSLLETVVRHYYSGLWRKIAKVVCNVNLWGQENLGGWTPIRR